jgi:hypothetical protein
MSTFGGSKRMYMIVKLNVMGSSPMLRIGHAHSNKDFLYTLAIAKQQGKKADLPSVPSLIISIFRHRHNRAMLIYDR